MFPKFSIHRSIKTYSLKKKEWRGRNVRPTIKDFLLDFRLSDLLPNPIISLSYKWASWCEIQLKLQWDQPVRVEMRTRDGFPGKFNKIDSF